jgi:hypothetical protein
LTFATGKEKVSKCLLNKKRFYDFRYYSSADNIYFFFSHCFHNRDSRFFDDRRSRASSRAESDGDADRRDQSEAGKSSASGRRRAGESSAGKFARRSAVAPNYESNDVTLPELGRVGVDMMNQKPLTLREAITLALENNKDIEVTRQNVRISEFDLRAADGVYQPRFFAQTFYERSVTPTASFFGGGANGEITQSGLTSNVQLQGSEPRFGGNYQVQFNNSRVNSTNLFNTLNPSFHVELEFSIRAADFSRAPVRPESSAD